MESNDEKPSGYEVKVDDMFHYMDESERYTHGTYATLEEAIHVCVQITLESLNHLYGEVQEQNCTPKMLRERWFAFGDDPWIAGFGTDVPFSAATFMTEGLLSAIIRSKKAL